MKTKILISCIVLSLIFSCQTVNDNSGEPSIKITTNEISIAYNANTFGLKLFREISRNSPDSNVIISPLSVAIPLAMAYNGANGATKDSMRKVLDFENYNDEEINIAFENLLDYFSNLDTETIIKIANSIWKHIPVPILQSFVKLCQEYYHAEYKEIDFFAPNSLDSINNWIYENTHGTIKNALDRIPPLAVLYLINTLYYKGVWKYKFDESNTKPGYFFSINDKTINCKMMSQKNKFPINLTDQYTAISLPYNDEKFYMIIILPDCSTDINTFSENFTIEKWNEIINNLEIPEDSVLLKLPRMKLEYNSLLNDALKNLGMGICFDFYKADFSKIFGKTGYWISRVIHNTFIEVNEQGTEASASTIVEFYRLGEEKLIYINVDRPFIFAIYEKLTGAILFIGKVIEIPEET